jgi:hypothetical protein
MGPSGQYPATFGLALDRWVDLSLEVGKSNFSDESSAAFFGYHPVTETHQGPVPEVAQKLCPDLFPGERLASDEPSYLRVGPESGAFFEVLEAMTAKNQTFCLYRWNRVDRTGSLHGRGLALLAGTLRFDIRRLAISSR